MGTAKAIVTEVQATGSASDGMEAWLVHVWGKGVGMPSEVWMDLSVAMALPWYVEWLLPRNVACLSWAL